eukprot:g10559.t1
MGSNFQTPRVNASVLDQYVGHTVCLVGRVLSTSEGASESVLETSDGKEVTIKMAPGSTWTSEYVEVIGHLHEDQKVQEFKSTDFGDSFDLATYEKAIQLMTGKYSYLFYNPQE